MHDKFRVIVADDEKLTARSIAKNIEKAHSAFSVSGIAHNGVEALELVEKHLPHVVFSDIKMPLMSGLELFAALSERRPKIKKVIISGYDDFQFVRDALQSQAYDYLLKPVNRNELLDTLQKLYSQLVGEHAELSVELSRTPEQVVETLQRYIQENYAQSLDFSAIALRYGFSGSYLTRIFRSHTGTPPQQFLTNCRMVAAKQLLADTQLLVRDVGARVGYADPFHFCKVFKNRTGLSPLKYRKQHRTDNK